MKLKKIVCTCAAATIIASPCMAGEKDYSYCRKFAAAAEAVMKGRQKGIPKSEWIDLIIENEGRKQNKEMMELIIKKSYKAPIYNTKAKKQEAVQNFHDAMLYMCIGAWEAE